MILVLFGTNPYAFNRLMNIVDELSMLSSEKIIVQNGNTPCTSTRVQSHKFIEYSEISQLIKAARIVITQGGYGSIRDALKQKKPLVAVPRYKELGESQDNQAEIVREFERLGYLSAIYKDSKNAIQIILDADKCQLAANNKSQIPDLVNHALNQYLG